MKRVFITNWTKYCLLLSGISGMLLFTSCGDRERRNADEAEYGMGSDAEATDSGLSGTDEYERTSNTAVQRNYDVASMGTAAANRKKIEASGTNLNDQDYQRLRQDYDNLNQQIRDSYRQSPGLNMRYTDDYKTADYSYDYYGVYYDGINDAQTRTRFTEMEQRRTDLLNQMRGKKDPKTGAYIAAEMDAVPKEGYDQLYNHLQNKLSGNNQQQSPSQQQSAKPDNMSNLSGTVFVEFVVDKNGKISNPKVVESFVSEGNAGNAQGNLENSGSAGTPGNTATTGSTTDQTTTQSQQIQGQTGTTSNMGTNQNSAGTTASGSNTQASTAQTKQLEQQVIEAINSTSGMWEPAQMGGKPVAALVQMPVPLGNNAMQSGMGTNQGNMNGGTNQGGTQNNNTGIDNNGTQAGGTNTNNGEVSTGTNSGTSGSGTQSGTGTTGGGTSGGNNTGTGTSGGGTNNTGGNR